MILPTPELVIRQYVHESLVQILFGVFAGLVPAAVFIGCLCVVDTRADEASFVTSSAEVGLHAQAAVLESSVTTEPDVAADTSRESYKSRPAICTLVEYARIIRDEHNARVHCYEAQEEAYAHMLHHMRSDAHADDDVVKAFFGLRIGFPYTGGDQEAIDAAKALSYYVPEGCDP